jgi:hypothetical protein
MHLLFFIRVTEDDDVTVSGRPKSPRLRSPKSCLASSSSRKVSGKVSSSSEKRSTTGIPSKGSLCSCTSDGGLWEETFDGDIGDSKDSDGEGDDVEASLCEDEEPLMDEHESLVPLLSSIMNK